MVRPGARSSARPRRATRSGRRWPRRLRVPGRIQQPCGNRNHQCRHDRGGKRVGQLVGLRRAGSGVQRGHRQLERPRRDLPEERYQLFVTMDRDRRRPEPDRRAGRHRVRLLRRRPNYDAWYEMYGDNAVNSGYKVELSPATDPVAPGDGMTASVSLAGSTWTLAIATRPRAGRPAPPSPSPAPGAATVVGRMDRGAARGRWLAFHAVRLRQRRFTERQPRTPGQRPDRGSPTSRSRWSATGPGDPGSARRRRLRASTSPGTPAADPLRDL